MFEDILFVGHVYISYLCGLGMNVCMSVWTFGRLCDILINMSCACVSPALKVVNAVGMGALGNMLLRAMAGGSDASHNILQSSITQRDTQHHQAHKCKRTLRTYMF